MKDAEQAWNNLSELQRMSWSKTVFVSGFNAALKMVEEKMKKIHDKTPSHRVIDAWFELQDWLKERGEG